jgi:hypothetical protein
MRTILPFIMAALIVMPTVSCGPGKERLYVADAAFKEAGFIDMSVRMSC